MLKQKRDPTAAHQDLQARTPKMQGSTNAGSQKNIHSRVSPHSLHDRNQANHLFPPLLQNQGMINVYSKGNSQQKRKGSASYRVRFNPSIVSCKIQSQDADLRHHYYYCLGRRNPKKCILQQLGVAPTKRVGSQAAVSKNQSFPMCVCVCVCFSENNEWIILQVSSSMPQQKKHCNKIHSSLQTT